MCTSCAQLNFKRPSGTILHRNHPSEHRLYNQLTTFNTGVLPHWYREFMKPVLHYQNYKGGLWLHKFELQALVAERK